jgi:ubiquinone/menaquinone biosynthesis C-methylase UbiE
MKSQNIDQNYLLIQQYHNASNLNARAQLHIQFSKNKYGWFRWAFEQIDLPPTARFLELGCGPGWFWVENSNRIPAGWDITLSDFSPGMRQEAQQNLHNTQHPFHFEIIDAQSIPFEDASFDAVMANHMLYHVPDRDKAFSEIRRILKPGGKFFAATNGQNHIKEMDELIERFAPNTDFWGGFSASGSFTLENGAAQLMKYFSDVCACWYDDAMIVTESEPLVAYILSGKATQTLTDGQIAELKRFVESEIAANGGIYITKATGMFQSRRAQ